MSHHVSCARIDGLTATHSNLQAQKMNRTRCISSIIRDDRIGQAGAFSLVRTLRADESLQSSFT
eukprot:CAMPEP_0115870142 /NCGR_PEP_ID=MMETSP0287-20121206/22169_1 /TAXON_ID=412157 /ORGANISM="Chrysochromulina rotalis, Strain UIO044" /LENGTH=63 /DNA_ID=CAMNT_0003324845 /DNA_START=201 /DNA_END=388 /DNA_ORIENTATION=+